MFPDVPQAGDVNRLQTVAMYTPGEMSLTRNGERQLFSIVLSGADGEWANLFSSPSLPHGLDMVHSAILGEGGFLTVESDEAAKRWVICDYRGGEVKMREVPPYRYGIAVRDDGAFITVSDFRAEEHGLYVGDRRRAPGLTGNGIALIDGGKGGALVTRYGQGHPGPFNGVPGALFFVPPKFLN